MLASLIPAIAGIIGTLVDKSVTDKDEAEKLKAKMTQQLLSLNAQELKSSTEIILAEVQGESWLQRMWRPLLMVWFAILVGAYWFGWTPVNLPVESVNQLFTLVQIGIGGYVVGRSGEKIVKEWKQ